MFLRVGPFLFVGHIILFVEFSMLFKFSRGNFSLFFTFVNIFLGTNYFTEPFPTYVIWSWTVIILALVGITLVLFYRDVKRKFSKTEEELKEKKE